MLVAMHTLMYKHVILLRNMHKIALVLMNAVLSNALICFTDRSMMIQLLLRVLALPTPEHASLL